MRRIILPILFMALAGLAVACSSSSKAAPAATATTQAAAVTNNVIKATPATGATPPSSDGAPGGGANGGTRVDGTVQAVSGSQVTLKDGTSFQVAATARVIKQQTITSADLKPGQFVAITADRQQDNTLLATIVNIFPASLTSIPGGQRPLPGGNLMTNATIDQVNGNAFTVTFPGGGASVTLAPNAQLTEQTDATVADIVAGGTISASVKDGVAQSVTLQ